MPAAAPFRLSANPAFGNAVTMQSYVKPIAVAILGLIAVTGQTNAQPRPAKPLPKAQAVPGDPAAGSEIFKSHCAVCHGKQGEGAALGPPLVGVVGAKAASSAFAGYTAALKASGAVWTPDKLDTFLSGPGKLIPGTAMMVSLPKAEDRQNLIAYLATLRK